MEPSEDAGPLIARCVVCRGNIFEGQPHETWEGGYYCQRHSLAYLRERARLFSRHIQQEETKEQISF